jgi:hypothetical protein
MGTNDRNAGPCDHCGQHVDVGAGVRISKGKKRFKVLLCLPCNNARLALVRHYERLGQGTQRRDQRPKENTDV